MCGRDSASKKGEKVQSRRGGKREVGLMIRVRMYEMPRDKRPFPSSPAVTHHGTQSSNPRTTSVGSTSSCTT